MGLLQYPLFVLLVFAILVEARGKNFQELLWGSSTPSDFELNYGRQSSTEKGRTRESQKAGHTGSEDSGTKWRGGWTPWSEWSVCSRPCDGGVSRQLRRCTSSQGCKGEPQRYKICNMQPCQDSQDFRARQCSAYDQIPYEGALLTWTPHYEEMEPCALTCRGKPQSHLQDGHIPLAEDSDDETVVVAQLASKVQDGTRCRPGSLDMCINGKCQRVGCDLRIGSNKRVDECGVCGGDGSSCARPLYQWETAPMSLCSVTCGGGYRMARPVCRNRISGTDADEQLCNASQRPEPAVQQCNMHMCPPKWTLGDWSSCSATCGGGSRSRKVECAAHTSNGTVQLANEEACHGQRPRHLEPCAEITCPHWVSQQWSGCSVSCGSGIQVRVVHCANGDDMSAEALGCPDESKPSSQRICSTGIVCPTYHPQHEEDDIEDLLPGVIYHTQPLIQPYPPVPAKAEKLIGEQIVPSEATFIKDAEWGPCSVTCGEGYRKREVHCKIFLEFSRTIAKLPDYKCAGPKPKEETERCVMEPCSMAYGTSYGDSNSPSLYPSDNFKSSGSSGLSGFEDSKIRVAPGTPGKSYSWKEQGYTHCSASCLGGVQELIVNCVRDDTQKVASPYMCSPETKPENRFRTCNDHPCPPRWNYTEFSQCSKPCGIGIQTREVSCIHEVARGMGNTVVVPNGMCPQPSPPDRQYCNVLDCPVKWHTSQWSKCNKACGGGIKERKVECKQIMAQNHVVDRPDSMCPSNKPPSTKSCNSKSCVHDGSSPMIITSDTSYIQHDPKKKKVTLKIGGSATVFYGTQVKIKCPVKKFNRTKISWFKDRAHLSKSKKYAISKKGALRIAEMKFPDAGRYTCEAGKSSADIVLHVKQRPGEFPSSEEIERQKASPLEDPNDSIDRNDGGYRSVNIGSEDQSHEQRQGGDSQSIYKIRERNRERQLQREREKEREREREMRYQTTSQLPMRYNPGSDDDYSEREMGSGNHGDDAIPSQMSVAGSDSPEKESSSSASRPMPHFLRLISNLQTFSNSRGQRMITDLHIINKPNDQDLDPFHRLLNNQNYHGNSAENDSEGVDYHKHRHNTISDLEKDLQSTLDDPRKSSTLPSFDTITSNHDSFENSVNTDGHSVMTNEEYIITADEKMNGIDDEDEEDSLGSITVLGHGKAENVKFEWAVTDWSKCSVSCGTEGFKMRSAHCMVRLDNTTKSVEASLCEDAGLESPTTIDKCETNECSSWVAGEWTPCAISRCHDRNTAVQKRIVQCMSGDNVVVSPRLCPKNKRPPHKQRCYNDKCKGVWKTEPWSECGGAECGERGSRYRILHCVWFGTRKPAGSSCRNNNRPPVVRPCRMPACPQKQKPRCKDSSKFCKNVRVMNMCHLEKYQDQCCHTCKEH